MIKIALTGDILISRRLPAKGYEGLDELTRLLNSYEVRLGNLETTVHNKEGYPAAFPGGTWTMTAPECLQDIKKMGFNLLSTANNHAMDYSHNGLLATIKHIKANGLLFAGTGENLAEATKPVFFECAEGRVAMISATSSFHDSYAAGNQRYDMQGRPGINPLRHRTIYEVTPDNFTALKKIAAEIGINDYHNQAIKEGYLLEKDNFNFAGFEFIEGESNKQRTYPLENDLERITRSIHEAKKQSDCVIVNIHSHQFSNGRKVNPPEFIQLFSRACIDAGARIIVGHGPHILRGIESYHGGLILYGLGNFIFQNETVRYLPAEFFEKYSLTQDEGIASAMDKRSKNGTIGLNVDMKAWESVVVGIELSSNLLRVKIHPISLGYSLPRYRKGWPVLDNKTDGVQDIKDLSLVFGTKINISEEGIGYINIKYN